MHAQRRRELVIRACRRARRFCAAGLRVGVARLFAVAAVAHQCDGSSAAHISTTAAQHSDPQRTRSERRGDQNFEACAGSSYSAAIVSTGRLAHDFHIMKALWKRWRGLMRVTQRLRAVPFSASHKHHHQPTSIAS